MLKWIAISFSRGPSQPRDWNCTLHWHADSLLLSHQFIIEDTTQQGPNDREAWGFQVGHRTYMPSLGMPPSSNSAVWKLPEPHCSGVSIKVPLHASIMIQLLVIGHDFKPPDRLLSPEVAGQGWKFQASNPSAVFLATSPHPAEVNTRPRNI